MIYVLYFLLALYAAAQFQQHGYEIKFERAILKRISDRFGSAKLVTFKYNRTCTAVNVTYSTDTDFGTDLQVVAQAYKFASNEYRLFPLRYGFNLCHTLKKNGFGLAKALSCGNFSGCPIKKGSYGVCNFFPDQNEFPPHIPAGSYMLELQLLYESSEMLMIEGYGTVVYPLI